MDTAPPEYVKMARERLYNSGEFNFYLNRRACASCRIEQTCDCPAPAEWLDAAAMEAYVAFTECLDTWVETLIAGRPYDRPLVEWEHRELSPQAEHQDCVPVDDVMEAAQR